jgi:hypothetical protein
MVQAQAADRPLHHRSPQAHAALDVAAVGAMRLVGGDVFFNVLDEDDLGHF